MTIVEEAPKPGAIGMASVVGQSVPRIDGAEKVTGQTVYGHDRRLPRALVGKIVRSPHPHARILSIDTSKAEALPGVKAVVTAADTPHIVYGFQSITDPRLADKLPLEDEKVRFIGDEVAAVAAEDAETAARAAELVEVEYEQLPAVFDVAEAAKPGAPVIHDLCPDNIADSFEYGAGDVEAGFAKADVIVERSWYSQPVAPAPMETHQSLCSWDARGRLTIYSSTQMPHLLRTHLAKVLGLTEGDVHVVKQPMGGGFGGRMEMHSLDPICALLARKADRPVSIIYTRYEQFLATRFRHPFEMTVRVGAKNDGTIVALEMDQELEAGSYMAQSAGVARVSAVNVATLYRVPDVRVRSRSVFTNNPYPSAFRGYGNSQGTYGLECTIDDLAEKLGMDAVDLRIMNGNVSGTHTYLGQRIDSCGYKECLELGRVAARWDEIRGKRTVTGRKARGIGVATTINVGGGARDQGDSDASGAMIVMRDDGSVNLMTGGQEIGTGGSTALAQIAAELLGVTTDRVIVENSDSDVIPWDIGCHAQRNIFCAGNAVKIAAEKAREILVEEVESQLGVAAGTYTLRDNGVFMNGETEPVASIGDIANAAHFRQNGRYIWSQGFYDPPTTKTDPHGHGHKSGAYSFGAQFIEVEVDLDTGQVEVVKVTAAHDVGRAINPAGVEAQIEGGIVQGLGQALCEELVYRDGELLNPAFSSYKIPTAADAPPIESIIVESYDPEGPFGAKGVAECTIVPPCPALSNAVYDATGVRVPRLPITPDKVLAGLRALDGGDDGEKKGFGRLFGGRR